MLKPGHIVLASSLFALACQPPASETSGPMLASADRPAPTAVATPAADPLSLTLLTAVPEVLPGGFEFNTNEADRSRPNKVSVVLNGPFDSQRISYTVYPTDAEALVGFAAIGEIPRERNVVRSEALTPLGMEGKIWGETSHEEYEGKPFTRTSLAVPVGRVVTLAQIVVTGGASPNASDATFALLKSAITHVRPHALPREASTTATAPAAQPQTAPAAAPSP